MMTLTAKEARALLAKPKRGNKYGARKTVLDGITFDSAAEARYYAALKLREKAGEVGGVELQRRFTVLGPKGEVVCTVVPDFCFWDHVEDRFRVVDVKGGKATQTPVFKLKQKLLRIFNGIEIEVVQ